MCLEYVRHTDLVTLTFDLLNIPFLGVVLHSSKVTAKFKDGKSVCSTVMVHFVPGLYDAR